MAPAASPQSTSAKKLKTTHAASPGGNGDEQVGDSLQAATRKEKVRHPEKPPCLHCVRSWVSGKTQEMGCFEPKGGRAQRCQRCSHGHACSPLPAVLVPWVRYMESNDSASHKRTCRVAMRQVLAMMNARPPILSDAELAPYRENTRPAPPVPTSRAEAHAMIATLRTWLAEQCE